MPASAWFTKWDFIVFLGVGTLTWLYAAGLHLDLQPHAVALLCFFGAVKLFYTRIRPDERIAEFANNFAQLLCFSALVMILSYLMVRAGFPLIDRYLAAADAAIGFDWVALFRWLQERPTVRSAAQIAYHSYAPQIIFLMVLFNATRQLDRGREFVTLFMACAMIVIPWSLFFPASSAWDYYGVADQVDAYHLGDFNAIRSGAMSEIRMTTASGLVTFPSLHAMNALAFIYITRGIRYLFLVALALNAAMLAATPIIGGHYLVDLIAGAALFPLAVWITRLWQINEKERALQHVQLVGKADSSTV